MEHDFSQDQRWISTHRCRRRQRGKGARVESCKEYLKAAARWLYSWKAPWSVIVIDASTTLRHVIVTAQTLIITSANKLSTRMLFSDCSHPDDQTTGWNISVLQWGKRELMKRRFKARTVTGRRIKPTLMHLNTNISITRSSLSHCKPNCSDQKGVLGPELRTLNFQPPSASLRRWCLSFLLREREGGGGVIH